MAIRSQCVVPVGKPSSFHRMAEIGTWFASKPVYDSIHSGWFSLHANQLLVGPCPCGYRIHSRFSLTHLYILARLCIC